jgi:N-methylhydantoinase B
VLFYVDNAVGIGGPAQTIGDGQDTYGFTVMAGAGLADVETHEQLDPLLFLWRRLSPNSAGPGLNRGGTGMEQAYAMQYADFASGPAWNGVAQVPPHGFGGGLPPSAGDYYILRETNLAALLAEGKMPTEARLEAERETTRNKITHLVLSRGDVFVACSGGGGGLSDPLLRDPERVAEDVRNRYATAEHARTAYGVVLDAAGRVDRAATEACRMACLAERIGHNPERAMSIPETTGVSVCPTDDGTAWTCGYCEAEFRSQSGDWRESDDIVVRESPIAERFAELKMMVRDRLEAPRVVLREHFCAGCGGALGAETLTEGLRSKPTERMADASARA